MNPKTDTYITVWTLAKLGWSNRRIARLKLPNSHHTVSTYYTEASELIESGELPIFAKDERKIRLRYCGSTSKLETIAVLYSSTNLKKGDCHDE